MVESNNKVLYAKRELICFCSVSYYFFFLHQRNGKKKNLQTIEFIV